MIRSPRTFVVTTPESLYLLVTSMRSRATLRTVETVIVDEIHALARDKRGSHLCITLERLAHVSAIQPARIGLSATQKPIELVAAILVGTRTDADGQAATARSWTPGTGGRSTSPSSCPTASSRRWPPASR